MSGGQASTRPKAMGARVITINHLVKKATGERLIIIIHHLVTTATGEAPPLLVATPTPRAAETGAVMAESLPARSVVVSSGMCEVPLQPKRGRRLCDSPRRRHLKRVSALFP
mmetsp:Transcript_47984/g.114044  ORF Transcript_47984/g.114044 Transcript_47984/m.114044 type:complete len:112 (-) Transcript_47984:551-886(-)